MSTHPNGYLSGLTTLTQMLQAEQHGTPSSLLDLQIQRDFGIDLRSLRGSAVGLDRAESMSLRMKMLEHVAYLLGRRDGVEGGLRADPTAWPGLDEVRDAINYHDIVHDGSHDPVYHSVLNAYADGLIAGTVHEYVRMNDRMAHLDHLIEAEALVGEAPAVVATALQSAEQALIAFEEDPHQGAVSLNRRYAVREALYACAQEQVESRLASELRATPAAAAEAMLYRVRMALRAEAARRPDTQKIMLLAAWMPVDVAKAREAAAETPAEPVHSPAGRGGRALV